MPKFTKQWTWRTPTTTVTYPEGYDDRIPAEQYRAARADGAFGKRGAADEETNDGDDGNGEPTGREGRADPPEGE